MKFRHFASFALLLMSLAACHKGHDSSEDRALTDSLLHQTADILFTDPRKAEHLLVGLTAPAMSAMYLPMLVSICHVQQMLSMR